MSNYKKKQGKNTPTDNFDNTNQDNHTNNSPNPDVILLAQLLPILNKATDYLKQILEKLAIDAETITKMPPSFVNSSGLWNLKQAQESLDIAVINAILGDTQYIRYKDWIVTLELKRTPELISN